MAATVELVVPDIGDYHDVPVIEVLVKPGDAVKKEAPLVMLESEKATMEVPADRAGIVREVVVKLGDKVSQGSVLVLLEAEGASTHAPPAASPAAASPSPVAASAPPVVSEAASVQAESAERPPVVASPPSGSSANGSPAPGVPANGAAGNPAAHSPATNGALPVNGVADGARVLVHASPGIRRFARELGVELSAVKGSGPNGRITRDDVQNHVKAALAAGPAPAKAAPGAGGLQLLPWPVVDFAKYGPVERVPLTRIQKISGPNLARNWAMIPHITQHDEADVTELENLRKTINAETPDVKVTMLAFLLKASVAALKRFPQFNASLDGDSLVLKHYYHLGFAADTPGGLVVPVIHDVDAKGVLEIARETATLAAKAREGKLMPAEMAGGTFTISSLGGIGGTAFTPIVNAPEVAILGVSRSVMRPHWDGASFVPRLMLPLSLSYDHRVVDGAAGARFCAYLSTVLADFRRVLL